MGSCGVCPFGLQSRGPWPLGLVAESLTLSLEMRGTSSSRLPLRGTTVYSGALQGFRQGSADLSGSNKPLIIISPRCWASLCRSHREGRPLRAGPHQRHHRRDVHGAADSRLLPRYRPRARAARAMLATAHAAPSALGPPPPQTVRAPPTVARGLAPPPSFFSNDLESR